jgi:2-polyprenyl-3-methyl-5-hydroxy-6-metoxy-1,4-benzoquinol methylase
MSKAGDREYQRRYFELAEHQYRRSSLLDPPVHTAVEVKRVLDRLHAARVETPVVDFGAGTGRLALPLAAAGYSVLAVDISESSLEVLRTAAQELALSPIRTETSLPENERFAAIVGADILHHIDLEELLPKLHAALRDGGKAIFSEPGGLNPSWYVYLALTHELRVEKRLVTCNLRTLRFAFEQSGFRDVQITGVGLLPRPLFRSTRACRRSDATGNLPVLRWFAYRYLIEATK